MIRKRRTAKEIEQLKLLLADIIQDTFDKNGQFISHEELARRHMLRNSSTRAAEEVAQYGALAVIYLRTSLDYAIVPVTAEIHNWTGDTDDEVKIANTVAGLRAGGSRVGWYHPASKDDWLWVYYVGHLASAGMHAIYHAAEQIDRNPKLISAEGRRRLAGRALRNLPVPPDKAETKMLEARLGS